jgi:hypothetical protein
MTGLAILYGFVNAVGYDAAPGVGTKIIDDNVPDVFQPPAQVLPGVDFTYQLFTQSRLKNQSLLIER